MRKQHYSLFVATRGDGVPAVYAHCEDGLVDVRYWLTATYSDPGILIDWGGHASTGHRRMLACALLGMARWGAENKAGAVDQLAELLRHAPDDWTFTAVELRGFLWGRTFWESVGSWIGVAPLMAPGQAAQPSRN